ncbi:MAG: hypothetical protein CMF40_00510 [Legionellales bacterium]|nr:hypothetical protein [Legionellales bacterium]
MAKKKARRKSKKLNQQSLTLNTAMGIVGVILLGFIYSFSKNTSHTGIPIEVNFPEKDIPRRLAADVYNENPLQNVKVEVLNGCGIKGIAAKTATFLRLEHQINVIRSDNADNHDYPYTIIITRKEELEARKLICRSFGIPLDNETILRHEPDESVDLDATIIIGKDIHTYPEIFAYISSVK